MSNNKSNENYMLLTLDLEYAEHLVLPYADGIELLSTLKNARVFKQPYNELSTAFEFKKGNVKTDIIGAQEYGEAILRCTILGETTSE